MSWCATLRLKLQRFVPGKQVRRLACQRPRPGQVASVHHSSTSARSLASQLSRMLANGLPRLAMDALGSGRHQDEGMQLWSSISDTVTDRLPCSR
jgi:hypothetical protein